MTTAPRFGALALLGATALGALLAVAPALRPPPGAAGLGQSVAAIVGDKVISRAEHERAVAALATAKRNPVTEDDRARVLHRLIEEELLVQRALEIGLTKSDRAVRAALVNAMIAQATAPATALQPDQDELREWYAARKDFFRPQPRLRIATLAIAAPTPQKIAAAQQALEANRSLDELRSPLSDGPALSAPDAMLPLSKLKDYVGGEIVDALAQTPSGGWTGPYRIDDFAVFYVVRERIDAPPPAYEATQDRIEAAWRRARIDDAFRRYLAWLERRAQVIRTDREETSR